jgi:MLTD_N.
MYKPTTFVWQPSAASLFKITVLSSALAALGITTGCSSTPQSAKTSKTKQVSGAGYLDASSLDSLEDLLSATDMRAVEGDRLLILKHGDVWKRMAVGFKMDLDHWDPRIEAQRSWFISRQPYLDRLSARASRYLYHTVKEAERRGLPTELALLPVIESSYDPLQQVVQQQQVYGNLFQVLAVFMVYNKRVCTMVVVTLLSLHVLHMSF